ncbi:MAG: hypothetical protein OEQ18_04175 [Gammaproteobacteria bacterium]|nr:hypothetical protein [Gammaproteobacteria bacterium]
MNKKVPNLFLGCLVAPLAAPVMMLLIILVVGEDLRGPSYKYGLNDAKEMFGIFGMFIIFGAPIAWAITAVVGMPIYFIAQRLGYINFWSISLGAAFVAILPLLVMSAPNSFVLYQEPEKSSFLFYSAVALCGYVVGSVFWFVSGLHKQYAHNKPLEPTR